MSSPPPDLLSSLPSVRELLEKPQVKVLFQRLGHTDVAVGVRHYLEQLNLDKLRADLQQRLTSGPLPSASAIAEQAARFVLDLDSVQQRRSVINATGRLFGPDWAALPLSESAQRAILDVGSGFTPVSTNSAQQASDLLRQQSGAEAALVSHSYESALWLVFATVASERQNILVAQAELGHTGTTSVREISNTTQAELVSVGSANVVHVSDYLSALNQQTAAILQMQWDSYQTVGHVHRVALPELVPIAKKQGVPLIAALDGARLTSSEKGSPACATSSLATGADLVILRGEGLVGSVPCGLILGSREWIDQIALLPMAGPLSLDPMRFAGLVETLRDSASNAVSVIPHTEIPLQRLLETSTENLRHRAQNLAEQLIACESVEGAEAIAIESALRGQRANSWAVAVTPAEGQLETISERLQAAHRPIVCNRRESELVFDLSGVSPAEDQAILEALSGGPET